MNLVLQGGPLTSDALSQLVALTGANHVVSLGREAWRLTGASEQHVIESYCAQHQLDFAWVPDDRRLAEVRLLALDLDCTLLAGPEEGAPGHVLEERLRLSPGADTLVERCRAHGIRTLLVSAGSSPLTQRLQQRLGTDYRLSNVPEINNGRLAGRVLGDIVDGAAKAATLVRVMREIGASPAQTVAVGDGANDVPMMKEAGVSIAYRAKPVVREHATHALDFAGLDGVLNLFI